VSFLSDLGNQLLTYGKEELSSHFADHYGTDHIGAQNDTVAYIGQVLNTVHAGSLSVRDAVDMINRAVFAFVTLANRFGERGRRGASEVTALARQVITDLGGTPAQVPGPGGGWLPPGSGIEQWITPATVAVGALLLYAFTRRRG